MNLPMSSIGIKDMRAFYTIVEEGKDLRQLPEDHRDAISCLPCSTEGIKLPYLNEFIKKYPYFVKGKAQFLIDKY